jgi:NAD(P)-dependent dehydrogenase (short-subunit alcohol dehydrogenase family)
MIDNTAHLGPGAAATFARPHLHDPHPQAGRAATMGTFGSSDWQNMDLHLSGQVAIVTGASSGIGRATAIALAAEGVRVLGVARHPPESDLPGVSHLSLDLADAAAPQQMIDHAIALHGRLDILVNNAAMARMSGGFLGESPEQWHETLELNLLAAVRAMQLALPHLLKGGGVVVNVTSVNSRMPSVQGPAYSASKAALLNVGKALSTEYAGRGLRVVTVSPGLTATPMWLGPQGIAHQMATKTDGDADAIARDTAAGLPLGRFLTPEEVANCICFLASPRASGVTGAELVVDGGLTRTT